MHGLTPQGLARRGTDTDGDVEETKRNLHQSRSAADKGGIPFETAPARQLIVDANRNAVGKSLESVFFFAENGSGGESDKALARARMQALRGGVTLNEADIVARLKAAFAQAMESDLWQANECAKDDRIDCLKSQLPSARYLAEERVGKPLDDATLYTPVVKAVFAREQARLMDEAKIFADHEDIDRMDRALEEAQATAPLSNVPFDHARAQKIIAKGTRLASFTAQRLGEEVVPSTQLSQPEPQPERPDPNISRQARDAALRNAEVIAQKITTSSPSPQDRSSLAFNLERCFRDAAEFAREAGDTFDEAAALTPLVKEAFALAAQWALQEAEHTAVPKEGSSSYYGIDEWVDTILDAAQRFSQRAGRPFDQAAAARIRLIF